MTFSEFFYTNKVLIFILTAAILFFYQYKDSSTPSNFSDPIPSVPKADFDKKLAKIDELKLESIENENKISQLEKKIQTRNTFLLFIIAIFIVFIIIFYRLRKEKEKLKLYIQNLKLNQQLKKKKKKELQNVLNSSYNPRNLVYAPPKIHGRMA